MHQFTLAVALSFWAFLLDQSYGQTTGLGPCNAPTPAPSAYPSASATAQQCITVSIPANAVSLGPAAYGTNPLVIPLGTQVTWVNNDSLPHTVTADDGSFNSGPMGPGLSFQHTFTTPGTYTYRCTIPGHNMQGTIQVQGPA